MSKTPTIRGESPEYTNPPNLLPSLLIPAGNRASEPAQHMTTYAAQLPRLQQHRWHPGTGLSDLILAPSDSTIAFYYNPSYLVPRAMIQDSVLDKELAAWFWLSFPNAALPSLRNMFPVDRLLTLLTNFTRHDGTTDTQDHAKDALHAVCIKLLEKFETPATCRSEKVDPSYYCGISFAILHYENRLFNFPPTNRGDKEQIGRLSSWKFHQDHVIVGIRSLCGERITRRLTWQQACNLASILTCPRPLLKNDITSYGQPPPAYTSVPEMRGSSIAFVSLVILSFLSYDIG
jgi:hypothetical protein